MLPKKTYASSLFIFSLAYLVAVFPFCFFRHDDWLILGNSILVLPKSWSFAWHATLLYKNQEVVWFFRPFFKIIVFAFYQVFGLNYYLWLTATLLMSLGMLAAGAWSLKLLGFNSERVNRFVLFFVATIPFHFGSLAWMGEGIMNIPVGFLLMLNVALFVKALQTTQRVFWNLLALLCFVLALGFKESAVFQPFFLFLLFLCDSTAKKELLGRRIRLWLPHAILGGAYLIFRLCKVPWNPSYAPHFTLSTIFRPLVLLLGSLSIPTILWLGLARPRWKDILESLKEKWPMFLFFIPSLLPYLGHGFFSPGWLFLPGIYLAWIFAWFAPSSPLEREPQFNKKFGIALCILSLLPIVHLLRDLGWWQWKEGQTKVVQLVESAPPEHFKYWVILDCPNPEYPKANLERVLGFEAGFYNLWLLKQNYPIAVRIEACDQLEAYKKRTDSLLMRWEFPNLTQISPAP